MWLDPSCLPSPLQRRRAGRTLDLLRANGTGTPMYDESPMAAVVHTEAARLARRARMSPAAAARADVLISLPSHVDAAGASAVAALTADAIGQAACSDVLGYVHREDAEAFLTRESHPARRPRARGAWQRAAIVEGEEEGVHGVSSMKHSSTSRASARLAGAVLLIAIHATGSVACEPRTPSSADRYEACLAESSSSREDAGAAHVASEDTAPPQYVSPGQLCCMRVCSPKHCLCTCEHEPCDH